MWARSVSFIAVFLWGATALAAAIDVRAFRWDGTNAQVAERVKVLENLPEGELRVFWWNIEHGDSNAILGAQDLETNLLSLAAHPVASPDVLVLGEYQPGTFAAPVTTALQATYPHRVYIPYGSAASSFGIQVFSKRIFAEHPGRTLEWTPPDVALRWQERYAAEWHDRSTYYDVTQGRYEHESSIWNRVFKRLTISDFGFDLIPTHLCQPWNALKSWAGGGKYAFFEVGGQIYIGTTHPLYHQVTRLKRMIAHAYDEEADRGKFALFGDFNLPSRTVFWKVSKTFALLTEGLINLFAPYDDDDLVTFPVPSSDNGGKYSKLQLDHAFVSPGLSSGAQVVLPFRGSDHFPIYFTVRRAR